MEALQKYGILTIGDGLVSQVPSLLISLATGILVTKASSEADFGSMLVKQLFWNSQGIVYCRCNDNLSWNCNSAESGTFCPLGIDF